ncbi:hypothetical protein QYF36_004936 [Acer negundo]|nr:hypothetical protein QYF36_004936 [Acer negundo]
MRSSQSPERLVEVRSKMGSEPPFLLALPLGLLKVRILEIAYDMLLRHCLIGGEEHLQVWGKGSSALVPARVKVSYETSSVPPSKMDASPSKSDTSPFDSGGRSTTSTDADAIPSS